MTSIATSTNRIRTIDILRALTMFLVIFVNDLWSVTGVPKWLGHTLAGEDGMGFSDIIFPLFLFIVGLSIPLAISIRIKRNESPSAIFSHILARTFALVTMGFFMVNYGLINQEAMGLNKQLWQILTATAIFLIWMDYRRWSGINKKLVWGLKIPGILLLVYLAWVYRGGIEESVTWMQPHWWGILGLIGWAYLLNCLLYLFIGPRLIYLAVAGIIFLYLNVQENGFFEFLPKIKLIVSASNHVLVLTGMLCTGLYLKFRNEKNGINHFLVLASIVGVFFICLGFLIRPVFPISKILATPSWTSICIGISLLFYVILFIVVEKWGFYKWANLIRPAGTSTLTCYLMPYFIYPAILLIGVQWSDFLSNGFIGIVKSLFFSLTIILFVGVLEKWNIRLQI